MRFPKLLLLSAALAGAPAIAGAAPATLGVATPAEIHRAADGVVEARHTYRHWQHREARRDWRRQKRWERRHWRHHHRPYRYYRPYRYNYGPRCYWSRYWHRRICRY